MAKEINIYMGRENDNEDIGLYVNDEKVGTVDSEDGENKIMAVFNDLLERNFHAGVDKGLLGGGLICIAGGIGWVLLSLIYGKTKKVGKY